MAAPRKLTRRTPSAAEFKALAHPLRMRILRPTLMTLDWYARVDTWFFAWRDWIYDFVRALPAWQKAREMVRTVRAWLRALVSGLFAR